MNWMYHGMGEGESRKMVLQESWQGLGEVLKSWWNGKRGQHKGVDLWGGVCHGYLDSDLS
jgi:hypothetical protein